MSYGAQLYRKLGTDKFYLGSTPGGVDSFGGKAYVYCHRAIGNLHCIFFVNNWHVWTDGM